ncbi:MAG: type II 3-dehydroquinate dehydratase [Acholeplasmataceae bacterium]
MRLLVIHGPNLNMLGKRDPQHYGTRTLEQLYDDLVDAFPEVDFTFFQSNHEGEILDVIHDSFADSFDALLINPGALTHTSIALRDAIEILEIPVVEVHLSDIGQREDFRRIDYVRAVCEAAFFGKGFESYLEAVEYLQEKDVV